MLNYEEQLAEIELLLNQFIRCEGDTPFDIDNWKNQGSSCIGCEFERDKVMGLVTNLVGELSESIVR